MAAEADKIYPCNAQWRERSVSMLSRLREMGIDNLFASDLNSAGFHIIAFAKKNFRKKNVSAAGRGQGMSEAAVVSYSPSEMTPLHGLCRRILFGKDFWQTLY
jgi:hypothetical protein